MAKLALVRASLVLITQDRLPCQSLGIGVQLITLIKLKVYIVMKFLGEAKVERDVRVY